MSVPAASTPAAGMGWDPLQRAVLAELGLPVLAAGVLYALSGPVQWLWRRRGARA